MSDDLRDELIAARDDVPTIADWADVVDDALLPIVERHVAQARAETAEQIAVALIDRAAKASRRRGSEGREEFLNGRLSAFQDGADIARQHAGEVVGDDA